MAQDYTKQAPNFRPPIFWRALVSKESNEKPDKSFTYMEELARGDDHWRLTLVHSAYRQGLSASVGNYLSRKTTRFSDYVERHHSTYKAGYSSRRLKVLSECSAIVGVTKAVGRGTKTLQLAGEDQTEARE